jgi:maleylpyruvate isomerase
MNTVTKTPQSLAGDIGRMQRESAMVMATVASLADDELNKPTKCEGWTRAHVIAHLARGADAMRNLATGAVTGQAIPAYESREKRDADIEAAAKLSAAELADDLERANARLLEVFQTLEDGVRVATVSMLFSGEVNVFSLPARRTTELIVHHDDLDTT